MSQECLKMWGSNMRNFQRENNLRSKSTFSFSNYPSFHVMLWSDSCKTLFHLDVHLSLIRFRFGKKHRRRRRRRRLDKSARFTQTQMHFQSD